MLRHQDNPFREFFVALTLHFAVGIPEVGAGGPGREDAPPSWGDRALGMESVLKKFPGRYSGPRMRGRMVKTARAQEGLTMEAWV